MKGQLTIRYNHKYRPNGRKIHLIVNWKIKYLATYVTTLNNQATKTTEHDAKVNERQNPKSLQNDHNNPRKLQTQEKTKTILQFVN